MEESSRKPVMMRPMTLAELMPSLGGIIPQTELQKLTGRKAKKPNAQPHTTGKNFKPWVPLTNAQLQAQLAKAFKPKPSPMRPPPSAMKRWNTSTKCDNKFQSRTAGNTSTKKLTARKILNFQPVKPRPTMSTAPQVSMRPPQRTPKQIEQDKKINKMLKHLDGKNRISGICKIQETPAVVKSDKSKNVKEDNKENAPQSTVTHDTPTVFDESFTNLLGKKSLPPPKTTQLPRKSIAPPTFRENNKKQKVLKPTQTNFVNEEDRNQTELQKNYLSPKTSQTDALFQHLRCNDKLTTDLSPTYSIANSEQSFLEQEKLINRDALTNIQPVLVIQPVVDDSPIVSTPFKKYRNVDEYFNESSECDDTKADNVTAFEGNLIDQNQSKEEGDIVSLCKLMGNAKVTLTDSFTKNDREMLITLKNELENSKRSLLDSVKYHEIMLNLVNERLNLYDSIRPGEVVTVKKVTPIKRSQSCKPFLWSSETNSNNTLKTVCDTLKRRVSKSPTFTIPKRSPCLRKRIFCKSVPINLNTMLNATPVPKSRSMYMKIKEDCNFLMTPVADKSLRACGVANTPAKMSFNLQNQLEKLYDESP